LLFLAHFSEGGVMDPTSDSRPEQERSSEKQEPLVEFAPDEAVVRALAQSAHPIEWTEAHKAVEAESERDLS
jgi:hypothetical protein